MYTPIGVKEKCEKYWPDVNSQSKRYAHMRVNNLKEIKTSTDMVERTLEVANLTKGAYVKRIYMLAYDHIMIKN